MRKRSKLKDKILSSGKLKINAINDCLEGTALLDRQLRGLDKELKESSKENEDTKFLMSIIGIGYSAQEVLVKIGDIGHFSDPEKFCSCLISPLYNSGETKKAGD